MSAEALLDWIGSAKKDLLAFPEPVIHAMGKSPSRLGRPTVIAL